MEIKFRSVYLVPSNNLKSRKKAHFKICVQNCSLNFAPAKYAALQGSRMTIQCEFGLGNGGFARVAMGTVSGGNSLSVAAQMQTRRRSESERNVAP